MIDHTLKQSTLCRLLVLVAAGVASSVRPANADGEAVYKDPPQPEVNPWGAQGIASDYRFAAYYTRKSYEEPWHERSRTDQYSDIMVKFGNGAEELVFGRRTSYRPVWVTEQGKFPLEEIVPRTGDGPEIRPDATNRFSRARIIESKPERVVIHWRYLPSPPEDIEKPDPTKFVDEYFVISPDRRIVRGFRPGAPRIDDWRDPSRVRVSVLTLSSDAIKTSQASETDRTLVLDAMGFERANEADPARSDTTECPATIGQPYAIWRFDEGDADSTEEEIGGTHSFIQGHKAYWKTGVSGTALAFDGWHSQVTLPADKAARPGKAHTIDAWAALAAYPWNFCPVVQQGDVIDEGPGWFLGFSPHGRPTLAVMVGGKRHALEAEQRIELYTWAHLTGVVDAAGGSLKIFVNGKEAASRTIPTGTIDYPKENEHAAIQIAHGPPLKTAWPVRFAVNYPYTLDGLIDEIRLFEKPLTGEQAAAMHKAFDPGEERRNKPDLKQRVLPIGDPAWKNFGAHYTHLDFYDTWDNMFRMSGHPDIVVTFDKSPGRYVLWHGVGYIPMMVTENGRWFSNEFNETWWRGCCEPMSDKKMMFGRVHIIEQSPARVVLRWRYPLSNIYYGIYGENESDDGWGEWVEWMFHIYPDGSIVKKMRVYESRDHEHEWHESMAIMGPGQHPETVVDKNNTLDLVTDGGEVRRYNWKTAPPRGVDYRDTVVHKVNMFAQWDPYTIQRFTGGDVYSGERTEYAVFPSWDHWPVSQLPSDGRKSRYSDRTSHSSLTHVKWDFSFSFGQQGHYVEKVLLEGLTTKDAEQLLPLAHSFLNPPAVEPQGDAFSARFDINQKAYVLTRGAGDVDKLRFTVDASDKQPLVHPAFVVENWGSDAKATIKLAGAAPGEIDIRQGIERRANGVTALVVWMEMTSPEPVTIEIAR